MRAIWLVLTLLILHTSLTTCKKHDAVVEDNDFAEFEDFEDEEDDGIVADEDQGEQDDDGRKSDAAQDDFRANFDEEEEDDSMMEDDDEFGHYRDEEEFENFESEKDTPKSKTPDKLPDLEIAKVPLHLRTSWDSFYLEMLMLVGLAVYFLNFLAGKSKNCKLATAWLSAHRELLETQFSIVGDDGVNKEVSSGVLMKESENVYALWCSGRACVEGMLVELKLLKRQDLINLLLRFFKPAADQIVVKVDLDEGKMDNFVFAIAHKRSASRIHREMNDLSQFTEKKSIEKYDVPSSYQLLSEIGEGTAAVLDKKVCQMLDKYEGVIEYIHVSDQYSGPKVQEETQPTKMPETKNCLIFCFSVGGKGQQTRAVDMENLKPLMQLVFYLTDKVARMQLSREARVKADKNRQKAAELFNKAAHSQRQEQAQQRREDRRKAEKEKLMAEEDPDRARKLEERENRRDAKKKQPKMKMMKIKSM